MIEIWTESGRIARQSDPASRSDLQRLAMRWMYRMNNRSRWVQQTKSRERMNEEAREALRDWGYSESAIRQLAKATVAEVSIPFENARDESRDYWEMRLFPWEFVLTAATRKLRQSHSLTVVRHLRSRVGPNTRSRAPAKLLLVESAPADLNDEFDFQRERELIKASCQLPHATALNNPTYQELCSEVAREKPDVVHVSAIDTRLGYERLSSCGYFSRLKLSAKSDSRGESDRPEEWRRDGILFKGADQDPIFVAPASESAAALAPGGAPPRFVGFNVWYSASHIAAHTVAAGAGAVLGFHTTFSDSLAELFFANFYRAWRESGWRELLAAFQFAWESLRGNSNSLQGTGIVLWSAESLVQPMSSARRAASKSTDAIHKKRESVISAQEARNHITVKVVPLSRLNFSLLHNNRPIFEEFSFTKRFDETLRDVKIEVKLLVGADSFPFKRTCHLSEPYRNLAGDIRVPLTSNLMRRADENIQTSLQISVRCEEITLYEDTHRVTLLPVDLWKDSDSDRQWLPAFVLPRDPAVTKIIQCAQNFLACLSDNVAQGFDGYQSTDPDADDPGAGIDLQVQAIWAALTLSLPLNYINPPPSYEPNSQRLRTPTQIIDSGRGTCIDLSLLLAACLEFVEIYPVVFLLEGHAFPGYWRSEEAYESFVNVSVSTKESNGMHSASENRFAWSVGSGSYSEIMKHVRQGNLVPIESTSLTARDGFWNSVEDGRANLRSRRDFHSLIDVRLARDSQNPVTPLPIGGAS